MITHEFVFPGSSKEFYQKIVNRGTGELLNYLKSDQAMSTRWYVDVDGYEFTIHTLPRVYQHGDVVYRLEFMVEGSKAGVGIWEQIEKDIPPKHELGCVIELFPRIDGRTNIKAVCLHPSFEQEFRSLEQEFRSIFGIDEQEQGSQQLQEQIITDLQVRTINKSGDWLTKTYTLDEWIGITALRHRWKTERGAIWTRLRHAQHFHIPQGVLSNWVTEYTL